MQCLGEFFQDGAQIIFSGSACFKREECQGSAFITQAQLAVGVADGAGVEVDSAFDEIAVEVCDQTADIAAFEPQFWSFSTASNETLRGGVGFA